MNVLLISFSVRRSPGNCENSLKFVSQYLKGKGVESALFDIKSLEITPCSGCNYDCSNPGSCPINDDVKLVYDKILLSDLVIFAIPIYSGALPARYFAWRERAQSYFTSKEQYHRYLDVTKGFIVIGKEEYGGREAVNFLQQGLDQPAEILLIQNDHYNQKSTEGKLSEIPEVQTKLVDFTEELLRKSR